jgi:type I restriction enzyme M protein
MDQGQLNWITNFIWGIADDVLRDIYVRGKYRDVILPMVVIRRLDAVLEGPAKKAVLDMKARMDAAGIANQDGALRQAAGQCFYNASPFTLRDLRSRSKAQQLKADFETYLDGFSPNVVEILDKFKFRNQISTLVENDILGSLIEKFLESSINLSPNPVQNPDGTTRIPGLDNHAMGTIFEELIRRFNEENNEEAGEHFTPRDVVKLMANLIFLPIADQIESTTYLVYDGACGTGGMLTVAEETLDRLAEEHGKDVSISLYGQESQPETYAISKADLLLKGEGAEAENFQHGSTLSQDAFRSRQFDFMLSNPPYGKSWKTDPVPTSGGGFKPEPELDRLSNIVRSFNEQFGNIDWKDGDKIRKVIAEEIPAKVAADKAYRNAQQHSDRQNARIEHDKALQRVVTDLLTDHTELFKQFSDNPSFRKWLADTVFSATYSAGAEV